MHRYVLGVSEKGDFLTFKASVNFIRREQDPFYTVSVIEFIHIVHHNMTIDCVGVPQRRMQ